jgi:hypothetical protein
MLRFYQRLEVLGATGGRWGTEMGWDSSPKVRNVNEGNVWVHPGVSSGEIYGQRRLWNA